LAASTLIILIFKIFEKIISKEKIFFEGKKKIVEYFTFMDSFFYFFSSLISSMLPNLAKSDILWTIATSATSQN
jgi:hypothetical protein